MANRLAISTAVGGGASNANLLTGWQFQQAPWPCLVKIILRSTTATDFMIVSTGSETIQQRSPVCGGGTLGVQPTDFAVPAIVFKAARGDQLSVAYFNGGAASNVDGYAEIQRIG
jgi:hypothetical protein